MNSSPPVLQLAEPDRQLIRLLGEPASHAHANPMLRYNAQSDSINKPVLGNYARLRLAALALREGNSQLAREQLDQVAQNSPAAVDAALLLAESYRYDGQGEQASAWLMRTASRFPGNPRAISGLILAGDDWRNQGADERALSVYKQAQARALENLQVLEELQNTPERLYHAITNTVAGNSTTVMDQLVLAMVRHGGGQVLQATRQLRHARQHLRCLRAEETSLHNAIQHATARDLSNHAFRTAATMEKAATEQEIEALTLMGANITTNNDLQTRLSDAQQRLQKLNRRLQSLASTAVPEALKKRKTSLAHRITQLGSDVETAKTQLYNALLKAMPGMQRYYRNLAGEAQLGEAMLMQG